MVDKAYAHFVKKDSHFWNISGIDAQIGLSGININVDSLNAIVQGAVAFDSPANSEQAESHDKFTLYANFNAAKRGIVIDVNIPHTTGLQTGQTGVYHQNKQIGVLSELTSVEDQPALLQGKLLIDPMLSELFTSKTHIVLRNKNRA